MNNFNIHKPFLYLYSITETEHMLIEIESSSLITQK